MKTVAIVQARMGSGRLPGKVMKKVGGHRVIDLLLRRLRQAQRIDDIVVATSELAIDDPLAAHLSENGAHVVRGSETDVLSRFVKAVDASCAEIAVRITGDCPLIMPELVDAAVAQFQSAAGIDYLSNVAPPTFPDGFDLEVFSAASIRIADQNAAEPYDREHVTPYLRREERFQKQNITAERDLSSIRLTVDESADIDVIDAVLRALSPNLEFGMSELVDLVDGSPELFHSNREIQRNEGATLGKGQKLWIRAKQVIPGGNMLLSKRAEMFLPEQWPTYFERAEGCCVQDLDGTEYFDVGFMGVGTNTLGYKHPEVDAAVLEAISKGTLSTLNCPEEVMLAERLIDINPWADMVRFARTGGEANAIAIRIARAAAGRDNVAICGYHGWHDWYLSANLSDDANLDGHLLPGLNPGGVPRSLAASTFPFMYNDVAALETLIATQNIGVIKMEVYRNVEPEDDFLRKVRAIADRHGIVLIFDECTSGFRETFGGLHKKYGVDPDMAVYGKTLGNGFAITAVTGRREVMEAAQSTFISSTFWTERIGPVAALKTLEVMEREKSWELITQTGKNYRKRLSSLAESSGVQIAISGLPSLTTYAISGEETAAFKSLITQEMLKAGFLAPPAFYASLAHTPSILERAFDALASVFDLIADCQAGRKQVIELLDGPVCHTGFNRLN